MSTLTYTGQLVVETCWCGVRHAIPAELQAQAHDHGRAIFCPLGHQWIVSKTTDQKLAEAHEETERVRRREQATRDLLHAEERSHAATRGHLTRQKKRVAAGVCPCCNRTFQNLARHMHGKHPGFGQAST